MKVAITGSHGLIGRALRASLEADGHTVVGIGRGTTDGIAGCDAVVNLAGAGIGDKRWSDGRKQLVLSSRTTTTSAVAAACAGPGGPRVLLSGSAIGYYGDRGDEVLTESSPAGSLFLSEVCVAWEAAVAPAADAGVRVAQLRTGIVLSGDGGALGKLVPLFRSGLGGRIGSGKQWMSWISLADEVGAIRYLLDQEVAGPVNLVAPAPVTNGELTKTLGHVLHRPTVVPVPSFGPKVLLGRELAYELLLASQRVHPAALERAGYQFQHPSLESALGWAVSTRST